MVKPKKLEQRIKEARLEALALYVCIQDPRVHWFPKAIIWIVAMYALSPIDIIPDFIPYIGYLDDMLIIPVGTWVAARMIPAPIMKEARRKIRLVKVKEGPVTWIFQVIITIVWLTAAVFIAVKIRKAILQE